MLILMRVCFDTQKCCSAQFSMLSEPLHVHTSFIIFMFLFYWWIFFSLLLMWMTIKVIVRKWKNKSLLTKTYAKLNLIEYFSHINIMRRLERGWMCVLWQSLCYDKEGNWNFWLIENKWEIGVTSSFCLLLDISLSYRYEILCLTTTTYEMFSII
jgi:hypothetical protein